MTYWKKVFEAGIQGTAEDIVVQEEVVGPVLPVHIQVAPRHEFTITSSDSDGSSSDVEYINPPSSQQPGVVEPQHEAHRLLRHRRLSDEDWILDTTYCIQWSQAALVARGGNRVNAMVLLQSLEWSLRGQASALNRVLARLVDMGFNDMPARVCLLMNNGEEASALDDLLLNKVYVSVSDHERAGYEGACVPIARALAMTIIR